MFSFHSREVEKPHPWLASSSIIRNHRLCFQKTLTGLRFTSSVAESYYNIYRGQVDNFTQPASGGFTSSLLATEAKSRSRSQRRWPTERTPRPLAVAPPPLTTGRNFSTAGSSNRESELVRRPASFLSSLEFQMRSGARSGFDGIGTCPGLSVQSRFYFPALNLVVCSLIACCGSEVLPASAM